MGLSVSNRHQECIDTLVLSLDNGLGEDKRVVCVFVSIRDPVLLAENSWCGNLKLLLLLVIRSGGLHLHCIITVAKLR